MNLATKLKAEAGAVPLQTAVLCVDCECVSNSRMDYCSVCGSHSLLSLAKIVGHSHIPHETHDLEASQETLFEVKIAITWKHILPRELNGAIESVDKLIGPWLMNGEASYHVDVAPVLESQEVEESKAA